MREGRFRVWIRVTKEVEEVEAVKEVEDEFAAAAASDGM